LTPGVDRTEIQIEPVQHLADHLVGRGRDVTAVEQALDSRDVSLDEPLGDSEDRRQIDVLPDPAASGVEETVAREELQERAQKAIAEFRKGLSERDSAILDRRVLNEDPETLQVLGDRFGTTREAVRQAETRLMRRLKEFMRERFEVLGRVKISPE